MNIKFSNDIMNIKFTQELLSLYVENRRLNRIDLREGGIIQEIDKLLNQRNGFDYYFVKDENIIIIPLIHINDPSINEIKFLEWTFTNPIVFLRIVEWNNNDMLVSSLWFGQVKFIRRNIKMKWNLIS